MHLKVTYNKGKQKSKRFWKVFFYGGKNSFFRAKNLSANTVRILFTPFFSAVYNQELWILQTNREQVMMARVWYMKVGTRHLFSYLCCARGGYVASLSGESTKLVRLKVILWKQYIWPEPIWIKVKNWWQFVSIETHSFRSLGLSRLLVFPFVYQFNSRIEALFAY